MTSAPGRRFYSADHHFSHAAILRYCARPWPDVETMDEALIQAHNDVVGQSDEVWFLGDFSLSLRALALVERLNGRKHLVAGNHDRCWSAINNPASAARQTRRYLDAGFESVYPEGLVLGHEIGGQEVVLSHLPYVGDSREHARYEDVRPRDEGLPLICGHVHTRWARQGRQINVGVDVRGYRPVPEEDLVMMIEEAMGGHLGLARSQSPPPLPPAPLCPDAVPNDNLRIGSLQ